MNDVQSTLVAHCGARKIAREELIELPVPEATRTHQPLGHHEVVESLEEALSYRHLSVVRDEYAVSADGMRMFGVMDLNAQFTAARFSIGLRNSNDKSMRLALTAGYRVFVCDNMAFSGDFAPLSHKHTSKFSLRDSIAIAVDRIQRNFETLEAQVRAMAAFGLSDDDAKLFIYRAFLDRALKGVPRNLMWDVHDHYFEPKHEEFRQRNLWSLSNAFTSAFKSLSPMKQYEVTARLGAFFADERSARGNTVGIIPRPQLVPPRPALAQASTPVDDDDDDFRYDYDDMPNSAPGPIPKEEGPTPNNPQEEQLQKAAA
jgi:hypothetical protein